jgi:hypothetical protein
MVPSNDDFVAMRETCQEIVEMNYVVRQTDICKVSAVEKYVSIRYLEKVC